MKQVSRYAIPYGQQDPIASGYCLALSYKIIGSTRASAPLARREKAKRNLCRILKKWKALGDSGPEKIVYPLQHDLPKGSSFSASGLTGSDAHLLKIFDNIARDLGFSLGLAEFQYHTIGVVEGIRNEKDLREAKVEDYEERIIDIEHLIDLEGNAIMDTVHHDETTFLRDYEEFAELIEEGSWTEADFDERDNWLSLGE